jgi:MFS family permease
LSRYRALLRLPEARAPLVGSAVGSLPIGMFGLAILLLARESTGSFADAGRVVAAFGLANALGAVAQGRLMDRLGQTRVLRGAAAIHAAGLAALVLAAAEDAPVPALAGCALVAGASLPQLPAAMRSLWGMLVADVEARRTAYALVSIVFEVSVIGAPVLVAGIVALASPSAAVVVAATVSAGGAAAFSLTAASRRWRGEPHAVGWLGPLEAPGMRVTLLVLTLFGTAIGVIQVAAPAFMAERGSPEAGGLLLAALSGGSLVGGIVYGARSWPGAPRRQLVALMAGLAAGYCLLALAGVPVVLAALLAAAGLLLAPTTVVGSALLDRVAPPGTATEAFTVMVMGIVAGTAVGNGLGGAIVEYATFVAAVLAAGGVAASGALVALRIR